MFYKKPEFFFESHVGQGFGVIAATLSTQHKMSQPFLIEGLVTKITL